MGEIIQNAGCITRPVANARQAVNAIEALPPCLILLDILIADIDSLLFCTMLKKNVTTREIPVIFVSAHYVLEDKLKCLRAGAVDYMAAPFEAEEFIMRIKMYLKLFREKFEMEENYTKLYTVINDQINMLYEAKQHVVNALVKLVIKMNYNMSQHFEYVAKNSRMLAISLQMSSKYRNKITSGFIDGIELTAPLFHIGRMLIGNEGPGSVCDISEEGMGGAKIHTLAGAALLEELLAMNTQNEFLKLALDITKYHHENWDGSGYPEGISGMDIPLSARIISVVNTFNLLISHADYGKAYSYERTLEYINKKSGIYFDPDIIYVFNKIQYQLKY